MLLIARTNRKDLKVCNTEMFQCEKIGTEFITVSNEIRGNIEIPIKKFNRVFQLGFCITTHKSQGQTFNKPYAIHEWSLMDH